MDFNDAPMRRIIQSIGLFVAGVILLSLALGIVVGAPRGNTPGSQSGSASSSAYADKGDDTNATAKSTTGTGDDDQNQSRDDSNAEGWLAIIFGLGLTGVVVYYMFRSGGKPWIMPTF